MKMYILCFINVMMVTISACGSKDINLEVNKHRKELTGKTNVGEVIAGNPTNQQELEIVKNGGKSTKNS